MSVKLSTSEEIAEVLFETLIDNASDAQMERFAELLTRLKEKYPRSYNNIMRNQPLAAHMLQSIQEACEYTGVLGEMAK